MSLHIANLSPRIRKDELERVFNKFGRCTMQLKDGYGFAVYDFRGDAEKALRTLKGRKICGESLYLSWSNKQPKPLQRVARSARSDDMQYGRNSDQADTIDDRKSLRSRGDYSTSDKKQPDKDRERDKFTAVPDDRRNTKLKDGGHYDRREVVLAEGDHVKVEPSPMDNGRWEERIDHIQNGTDFDGQIEFDRYEPNYGNERGVERENRGFECLAGQPSVGTSQENNRRVHLDTKRGQQTCFKCGAAGHKMRDCPMEVYSHEKSAYHSDYRNDTKGRSEVGRIDSESRSRGRLQSSSRNTRSPEKNRRVRPVINKGHQTCFKCGAAGHKMCDCPLKENFREQSTYRSDHRHDTKGKSEVGRETSESRFGDRLQSSTRNSRSLRQVDNDRKLSYSGKDRVNRRGSSGKDESGRDRIEDYDRKRHREMDDHSAEIHDDKKLRVLALSHVHSDRTSPELGICSRSIKPTVGLSSRSRSGSPIPQGPQSLSVSSSSRSLKMKSRSRSRSRSRSPYSSSSISLVRSSPSSPKKAEVNGFSEGASSPMSKEMPIEVQEHIEPEVREENMSVANGVEKSLSGYTDNTTGDQLMEVPVKRKQSEHDSETPNSTTHTDVSLNGYVQDDQNLQHQEALPGKSQQLEVETIQKNEFSQTEVPLKNEDVSSSGKVIGDLQLYQPHNDGGGGPSEPYVSCEDKVSCSSLLEKDDEESAAAKVTAEKLREVEELENADALEITKSLEPANSSDRKAPSNLLVGNHLSISAEELSKVLKHYGLDHLEDNEQILDVEDYFGSSRLWPWPMIYYRRLKKGPISLENYAKRVAQNKAFSITDKYVRSSSGWGEPIEEHC